MVAKYPESNADALYIHGEEIALDELLQACMRHFRGFNINDLMIEQRNIQIDHFGYDLYDPVDWQQYFIVTRK